MKRQGMALQHIVILMMCSVVLQSCFKEEINHEPKMISYDITPSSVRPGDTVDIQIVAGDEDSDNIIYAWILESGVFVSDTNKNYIRWKVPYLEGETNLKVNLNDKKVINTVKIPIQVPAYIYDDFSDQHTNWKATDCGVAYNNGSADITASTSGTDAIFIAAPGKNINPPYTILMNLGLAGSSPAYVIDDKYGMYLDFWNVGADTMIKALWCRIYPASGTYNWKISVLENQPQSNVWVSLDQYSSGTSTNILTQNGQANKLKLVVEADNTLKMYCNDILLYSTTALKTDYNVVDSVSPGLVLQYAGVRSSAGTITIDNVHVSTDTTSLASELF